MAVKSNNSLQMKSVIYLTKHMHAATTHSYMARMYSTDGSQLIHVTEHLHTALVGYHVCYRLVHVKDLTADKNPNP